MGIFALGDLHLSLGVSKPMDIFGAQWINHEEKIARRWWQVVGEEDLVVVPGDISWAMDIEEAQPDLVWLGGLPGEKALLRGNHDYWWSGIGKVRAALPAGVHAIQNDYFPWEDWAVCGSRGWICPGPQGFESVHDEKIYLREVKRLELSLEAASRDGFEQIIVALHYPPTNGEGEPSGFTELFSCYPVKKCIYGHLHGDAQAGAREGIWQGVEFYLVAADHVEFTPVPITL